MHQKENSLRANNTSAGEEVVEVEVGDDEDGVAGGTEGGDGVDDGGVGDAGHANSADGWGGGGVLKETKAVHVILFGKPLFVDAEKDQIALEEEGLDSVENALALLRRSAERFGELRDG
jgi:hypothetical protein